MWERKKKRADKWEKDNILKKKGKGQNIIIFNIKINFNWFIDEHKPITNFVWLRVRPK